MSVPDPGSLAARIRAEAVRRGLANAADGALDALEEILFGKVGGAAEVLAREEAADPLDRLRAQYAKGAPPSPAPPKADPEAEARKQLEELKRQRR
ncbi:MAG: hypothetical protein ACOZNI_11640 [Myxococcota bacterium]